MTKYLLISLVFLSTCSRAQEVEISSVIYSIISGHTMYYQMLDREAYQEGDPIYKDYSRTWHTLQTAELISALGVGFTIALDSELDWKVILANLGIAGGIRWIVRDGTYQLLQGNSFWHLSDNSYAQFEKTGLPIIKIGFLLSALLIRYFIL